MMDLPVILVVLRINRKTIQLRQLLASEQKRQADDLLSRQIKAARDQVPDTAERDSRQGSIAEIQTLDQ